MKGIIKRKSILFWTLMLILCGLFCVGLFLYILFSGDELTADDIAASCFFIFFGLSCLVMGIIGIIVDCKRFITASETGIEAYASYVLVGRRLSCRYDDIRSVRIANGDTLCISCTDDFGDHDYEVTGLQNVAEMLQYIKKHTRYKKPQAGIEELKATVSALKASSKKACKKLLFLFGGMFAVLIIDVLATKAKDIADFDPAELLIFILCFALIVFLMICVIINLRRMLKSNSMLNRKRSELSQLVLRTSPTEPGNVVAVYLNDSSHATYRCVIYRLHPSEEVFYIIEALNDECEVVNVESANYPNLEPLAPIIEDWHEIPIPERK